MKSSLTGKEMGLEIVNAALIFGQGFLKERNV